MALRTSTDYLAESGLEHAKGLILNPQDVSGEFWEGANGQQLITGSNDYYDVTILKTGNCNYLITSEAYREKSSEKIGRSNLLAQLRLDPCIALWVGSSWTAELQTTVNGDVYCHGNLSGDSRIRGDAFAKDNITITSSSVIGSRTALISQPPIALPGLVPEQFSSNYFIGNSNYSVDTIVVPDFTGNYEPSLANPAGIYYCNGDANLPGNLNLNGLLVVKGNLRVKGTNNVINAVKNFPGLIVGDELIMEDGGTLQINGLAQVRQKISIKSGASNVHISINGALLILNGKIDGLPISTGSKDVIVTSVPDKAAIQIGRRREILCGGLLLAGHFLEVYRGINFLL